ncbi:MAG: hypothetical protein EXR70_24190 [Deltaproteobacteria bacterium]|nr:hypothetical protein [Deltaproteobacteria bacterium]
MLVIRDHLLLLLAFVGIVGCASTERLYYRPASSAAVTPPERSVANEYFKSIAPFESLNPPAASSSPTLTKNEIDARTPNREELPAHVR